ncbi:MAG: ribonuclease Y [Chloroflexota bacterium]
MESLNLGVPILILVVMGVTYIILGGLLGFFVRQILSTKTFKAAEIEAKRLLDEANVKSKQVLVEAREDGTKLKAEAENELKERRAELQRQERRLVQKEETLERKLDSAERREHNLANKEKEADNIKAQLEELRNRRLHELEQVSGMSSDEARQLLLQNIEGEIRDEASRRVREFEARVKEESETKARDILATAIQRYASDVTTETTVSVVSLPNDDMKGRLIGREGRNIRALEQATGVDLIIDDTPGTVTISSFDPIRREIARVALNKLILDGRIHPARVEEVVEKARSEVEATIKAEGEQAMYKSGVQGLHPELVKLVGRLKFRTSYGQNMLNHSLEVAALSGMLAAELNTNVAHAKKAGLLHDIGKGLSQEVEGPHALVGAEVVKQWEKLPEIAQAVAEHHNETPTSSILGFIVATADAISGSRLGARHESVEQYLKRIEDLEQVATSFPGVEKAYAIQAGREIRIMVKPDSIDDLGVMRLARDIVKKIEENLAYPGQIKVTVVRETRAVDYAK